MKPRKVFHGKDVRMSITIGGVTTVIEPFTVTDPNYCVHGRPDPNICPHCNGTNNPQTGEEEMKLVIIESPYAGHVGRNKRYLRACMKDSLMRGESPYASHGLYTQEGVLDDNDPGERDTGIKAGFAWRRAADYTVVYEDLGISKGMQYGIEHAEKHGHPVIYRKLGGEWV